MVIFCLSFESGFTFLSQSYTATGFRLCREKLRELSDNHEAFADENSMTSLEKELKKWKTQTTRHEKKVRRTHSGRLL